MSKAIKIIVIALGAILILSVAALVTVILITNKSDEPKTLTIDEMNDFAYDTEELTTDLKDNRFVRVQYRLIMDSKKSLKEVQKREFQIKNILIKELATLSEEDFAEDIDKIEGNIKTKLNEVMENGEIVEVYTIGKILQ